MTALQNLRLVRGFYTPRSALRYQNVVNTITSLKGSKFRNPRTNKVMKNNMVVHGKRVHFNPAFSFGSFDLSKVGAMLAVKGQSPLLSTMLKLLVACGGKLSKSYVKVTIVFLQTCRKLIKAQGLPGLVNYLKASSVLIQQVISGYRIKDLTPLKCRVARSKSGLPRFLPVEVRKCIVRKNIVMIKYVLTLCNIYRVLDFHGKVNLNSITDPSNINPDIIKDMNRYIPIYCAMILKRAKVTSLFQLFKSFISKLRTPHFPTIFKSSPTTLKLGPFEVAPYSSHPIAKLIAILRLKLPNYADLDRSFMIILNTCKTATSRLQNGDVSLGYMELEKLYNLISKYNKATYFEASPTVRNSVMKYVTEADKLIIPSRIVNGPMGKFGFKYESAGKVRIFAMVDWFTQVLLKPIHKALFKLNRLIKMDGTFNQYKPLRGIIHWKEMYSLDLTAATDRLPTFLQVGILEHLLKSKILAENWLKLLVKRGYKHPDTGTVYYYSTGQPMGALSS